MKYWAGIVFLFFAGMLAHAQTFSTGFEAEEGSDSFQLVFPIEDSSSFSGRYLSRLPVGTEFSHVFEYQLPDSLKGKNLEISISARYRFAAETGRCYFVADISHEDKNLVYRADSLASFNSTGNWAKFEAGTKVPADMTTNSRIKTYFWNPSNIAVDLDELEVRIAVLHTPSFIPEMEIPTIKGRPRVLAQQGIFELLYFPTSESVAIADRKGRLLTGPLGILSASKNQKSSHYKAKWRVYKQYENTDGTRITVLRNRSGLFRNRLTITTNKTSLIEVSLSSFSTRIKALGRHSIVLPFTELITEVYRDNGQLDTAQFQHEYYIGSGGLTAGKDDRCLHIFDPKPPVSMQLDTEAKLLLVNIDYDADHPQIHYPLARNKNDFFVDRSARRFGRGEELRAEISFFAGQTVPVLPRLMPYPKGYEAAIIWTEHADYTDLRTQRAVHFGHEDIIEAEKAVGGFTAHNIPVTKSVFWHNPDSVSNATTSEGLFPGLHASVSDDPEFFHFLKQLHKLGNEICLHTAGQFTENRDTVKKALRFMKNHFGSPTWIDHGYNNAEIFNRENAVCDGFNPGSDYFMADLWEEFGIKYFWNPYYEEVRPFEDWKTGGQFMIPYPGFGDAFPYRAVSKVNGFPNAVFWSTTGTLEVPEDPLWDYFFSEDHLQALIRHRSLWINHVYPAWARPGKGFWVMDEHKKVVVMPGLDRALQKLDRYRREGKILPLTIRDYLDYYTAVQQVVIERQTDNTFSVFNPGEQSIEGLSLIVRASYIEVNGKKPQMKELNGETIFWFDLPAHSTAYISY
jgi:hypothetical protein